MFSDVYDSLGYGIWVYEKDAYKYHPLSVILKKKFWVRRYYKKTK